MGAPLKLDPDRCLPTEAAARAIARDLLAEVEALPLLCPHGHCEAAWFAGDAPFEDAVSVFLWPDHYLLRMLYSQGIDLGALGVPGGGGPVETDRRAIWRRFAASYRLFRGTPSRLWLDHTFATLFDLRERLDETTAGAAYEAIGAALATDAFRPCALYQRFDIEVLATTEVALEPLEAHRATAATGWPGRVISTFRPDDVVDPDRPDFTANLDRLADLTGGDTGHWAGYLDALRARRAHFREAGGATATDHGHPSARTADLSAAEARALFDRVRRGGADAADAELFRAQMLTEMAAMSLDDGMVMQLHPGAWRNHNPWLFAHYGRDRGADIPTPTDYVAALKPLLDRFGNRADLTVILHTLDESAYSRELAPLAGHYPCLRLGAPWWFHDSPEGMRRFRRRTVSAAGFYNTAGFVDDSRAFVSLPARHDLARRIDCGFLAELVAEGRLDLDEARETAADLAYNLAKAAYRL